MGSDFDDVKRRLVAAVVLPECRDSRCCPPEPVWAALKKLSEARALDLELHLPRPISWPKIDPAISWDSQAQYLRFPDWVGGLSAGAAIRLTAHWLRRPRASRPQLIHGVGPRGSAAAVRIARVLGAHAIGWSGHLTGALEPKVIQNVDDLWALDDAAARDASRWGVRAFRATLTPEAASIPLGPPPSSAARLCILAPEGRFSPTVVRGVARSVRGLEVAVIGPQHQDQPAEWAPLAVRFVDPLDARARGAALEWSNGVLAPDPDPVYATLVEALLRGRALIVPHQRKPRCFDHRAGFGFHTYSAESLSDALVELWAANERRRIKLEVLRTIGESEALEAYAPHFIHRTQVFGR